MIRYQLTIEISKPLKEVTDLYANRSLIHKWQPDLLDSQQVESYPYAKFTHQLALGRRKIKLVETIIRNELPVHFDYTNELKGVSQSIFNSFEAVGPNATRWVCDTEYRFKGLMHIVSLFMKGNLKQQTGLLMHNFKHFAENYDNRKR